MTRSSGINLAAATFAVLCAACGGDSSPQTGITPPGPSIAVTPASSGVNVVQGGNTTLDVRVARNNGYAGPVDLTVEAAPTGVTATFASPTLSDGSTSSSLTIAVAANVAVGSYQLTVRGRGQGVPDHTANLALVVTQASGATVSLKFCDSLPIWVAAQNDGGPWVQLTPTTQNTYSFSVTTRGGLATVLGAFNGFSTSVTYASASELAALGAESITACADPAHDTKVLYGTVTNLGSARAHVLLGAASADVAGTNSSFTLAGAPNQASDLLLLRDTDPTGDTPSIDKMIVRRGLNLQNGATIPALDMSSSEGFATGTANATILGLGTDVAEVSSDFITATRTAGTLSVSDGATQAFTVVPSSRLATGDIHRLTVAAGSLDVTEVHEAVAWFHTPSDRTITLGPALAAPTISSVSAAAPQRLRLLLPSQNEYGASVVAAFFQADPSAAQNVGLTVSAGYAGGKPNTWDLAIPDLSAAGYNAAWGLRAGTAVHWLVAAGNHAVIGEEVEPDGATESFAVRFGPTSTLAAARALTARPPWMRGRLTLSTRPPNPSRRRRTTDSTH